MKRSDFERFNAALGACADLYGKSLSEGALSLWWASLERYEIGQVERAFRQAVEDPESGQFMPKPADLIRRLDGTAADRSLIAWGKVLDAAQRVGAYQSVAFDDPAIHATITDMGGWPAVCRTDVDELPFVQRRFCETHKAYGKQGDSLRYPAMLAGAHDAINIAKGYAPAKPMLIGDPSSAQRVLQGGAAGSKTQITESVAQLLPAAIARITQ